MNLKLLDKLNLTDDEKIFIKESQTSTTTDMNQSRVVSEMYFIKTLENVADKIYAGI